MALPEREKLDEPTDLALSPKRGRPREVRELLTAISPQLRNTDGADLLIEALERVAHCEQDELNHCVAVASQRLRLSFYASIGRRPPTDVRSAPAYVTSTQRRYQLPSRNAARELIAQVEGYQSWRALMRATLSGQ